MSGGVPEVRLPGIHEAGIVGGTGEMNGPQVGVLAYSGPGGNLHIRVNVEFAEPSVNYDVFLSGGPEFLAIGTLITNASGWGDGMYAISHAALMDAKFKPGYRKDHIDLLQRAGGQVDAGTINYYLCEMEESRIRR